MDLSYWILSVFHSFPSFRLVAACEELQKLQKENESTKRKAENGYDRCVMGQGLGHTNTVFQVTSIKTRLSNQSVL